MSVWDQLIGQAGVVHTLQEAAEAARVMVNERKRAESGPDLFATSQDGHDTQDDDVSVEMPAGAQGRSMTHSWLIAGPPGSGRSVAAKAFAAALQCTGPTPGCGQCQGCHTTMIGSHPDVTVMSTQASIIAIDQARGLVEQAQQFPSLGRWSVFLVEDADRMTERTSNVLLKAIEEPPARTVWLLCAPSAEDMLPTIRSRCRQVTLRVPPAEDVAKLLVEQDGIDPQVALAAARSAQSHIGFARALAKDGDMRNNRRDAIGKTVMVQSVGEAVLAAQKLLDLAKEQADARTKDLDATEKAQLLHTLGLSDAKRIPPTARADIKRLEDEQKRRAKRSLVDALDRFLLDLLAVYRDVLMMQLETAQELVNVDLEGVIQRIAGQSSTTQTYLKVDAIETARHRLLSNGNTLLVLEALMLSLRPSAEGGPRVH